jgi:hypothetical protein
MRMMGGEPLEAGRGIEGRGGGGLLVGSLPLLLVKVRVRVKAIGRGKTLEARGGTQPLSIGGGSAGRMGVRLASSSSPPLHCPLPHFLPLPYPRPPQPK